MGNHGTIGIQMGRDPYGTTDIINHLFYFLGNLTMFEIERARKNT